MTLDDANRICAALPGAWYHSNADGGLEAWKVADKMFACYGHALDGISIKTADPESAQFLIEIGAAEKAKYFHRSWVRIPFDHPGVEALVDRIHTSYGMIRKSLPKKAQAELAAWQDGT
ncbi:MmcQ/YjbR family DNA-binding protein [Tateyamaria sp. syn59]|uniref:MmcQ/YjbR family DNA-binding protein n=1 Tax=Tateyamaria sp. syn59 TaxID=2576942 RepID=UPI0011BF452E|nr:MmcQ/YjbR family DNA-binding protein [Tateyamaria sp. syn59]